MKNEPKIRIKGFEGEWKERLFGNIMDCFSGGTPSANESSYYDGSIPFIRSGEINENHTALFLSEKGLNNSSARVIQKGTLLYALYGATSGEVSISKIQGAINQAILAIFPHKGYDNYFIKCWLERNKNRLISNYLQGGQGNLSGNIVKSFILKLPKDISEQRAIASYFRHLDSLIETADKKLTSLKQVKEASLQSMFPQEGQSVPKVRFKGFEGEWKATLLKEISQKVVEKNVKLQYKITLTNSAEYGIIDQLDFFDHKISNNDNIRNYYIVRDRDFVYNPRISTSAPVGPINQNLLGYVGVVSPLYYVFRIHNIDECYLRYFFKTKLWHTFMKDNGNSGARFDRLSITDDIFEKMPIIHPADTAEQRKIASFFVHIDKQIAIAQQRLDLLRRIKSACLNEMFV